MKKKLFYTLLAVGMALAPPLTQAWEPGQGIVGTPHDFTVGNTAGGEMPTIPPVDANGDPTQEQTDVGVCTFCHTPHKAQSTSLLWNHTLSSSNFSWDVAKTTAGTDFPTIDGQTYNGATAKCLSCHDGTVSIGDIAWFGEGKPTGTWNSMKHMAPEAANIANGADMSGNHPVAMPFPFNNAPSTYNGVTTGSGIALDEWQTDPTANGIRLFTDNGTGVITAGATVGKTGIECSSCHDPHNKQAVDDLFLRGMLTGSSSDYICLKCHNK